ncbi:hypothetical protein [Echinicola rosea]|uniref:hypothetical protein n=1 Tax=Echinicola rosea TaxID=1807691 RepID=UPI0010CA73D1|nr:hypothetical protein [Echinicola rosea]
MGNCRTGGERRTVKAKSGLCLSEKVPQVRPDAANGKTSNFHGSPVRITDSVFSFPVKGRAVASSLFVPALPPTDAR